MEINLLKYITFERTINAIKIISSFYLSKITGRPFVWGMPVSYSIEPTNYCNLKCPECPSGLGTLTRPIGLLQFDAFKKMIDEIKNTGFYVQLFFQGEPYINKQLPLMIDYAKKSNVYISVSSNGHYVSEKTVDNVLSHPPDKFIFSIDGLDEKSYQNYRIGGTFQQADSGLRLLINERNKRKQKHPYIELQFIVMKQNEHQIDDVMKYSKETGVDKITLKTMQVSSYENAEKFLPSNEKFRRYLLKNGEVKIKNKLKNHCFALWRTSVITWDGKVVPCCFDKDAEHNMGNLNGVSFKEIWYSDKYNSFRAKILSNRKGVDMCNNCTEGLKINILEIEN